MTTRESNESAFFFPCEGENLLGILSHPRTAPADTGVVIVVGGPQYRVGSHRQFLLLSRTLAGHGIPCLRFDYRGMGDSTGSMQSFENALPDLRAAIDAFFARVPGLRSVVVWGLCDAASIACLYAASDPRVGGLVLLNPWVRTESTAAKAVLQHYYTQRVLEASFWRKILRGEFNFSGSLRSALHLIGLAASGKRGGSANGDATATVEPVALPERMAQGFAAFRGPSLIIVSGRDLTAKEFLDVSEASPPWRAVLAAPRVTIEHFPKADHTFSTCTDQDAVADLTLAWIGRHFGHAGETVGAGREDAITQKRGLERF